jgi:hypothetical protein
MGEIVGLLLVIVIAVAILLLVGAIPGQIARGRGHLNATAINVCGWVGLVVWPAWFIGLIWAFTGPDRSKVVKRAYPSRRGFDPIPASFQPSPRVDQLDAEIVQALGGDADSAPAASTNPGGMFEIIGVDRATKMDTTWRVRADNAANAKVKAELEGIVVTSIRQV